MAIRTGQCLCGDVAYRIDGELGPIDHCHCSLCRRAHGAAFSTFGRVRRDALEIVRGGDGITRHRSTPEVERSFCARCGARLFFLHDALPDHAFVSVGSLDDQASVRPEAHIFVGSRAPWHVILDDLPQHEGHAPFD